MPDAEAAPGAALPEPNASTKAFYDALQEPAPVSEAPPAPVTDSAVLYVDNFADVSGSIQWDRNGIKTAEGPRNQRTVYFFHGMPEDGPLVMKVFEDNTTTGPDGEPGVLALAWEELPAKLPYSGFAYLGTRAEKMQLPLLQQARSAESLRDLRLNFRFKGVNAATGMPVMLKAGCRLEPMLADSYNKRLDFGAFIATDEWGNLSASLAEGKNIEAFLSAIETENPTAFKIIWSQGGPLVGYHAGDTLLIDDLAITRTAPQ